MLFTPSRGILAAILSANLDTLTHPLKKVQNKVWLLKTVLALVNKLQTTVHQFILGLFKFRQCPGLLVPSISAHTPELVVNVSMFFSYQ